MMGIKPLKVKDKVIAVWRINEAGSEKLELSIIGNNKISPFFRLVVLQYGNFFIKRLIWRSTFSCVVLWLVLPHVRKRHQIRLRWWWTNADLMARIYLTDLSRFQFFTLAQMRFDTSSNGYGRESGMWALYRRNVLLEVIWEKEI